MILSSVKYQSFCPDLSVLRPIDAYASVNHAIIGSDNGMSHERRQAIIWANAEILLIGHLGTISSEISINIYTFSFKKMPLELLCWKMAAILSGPQCVKCCTAVSLYGLKPQSSHSLEYYHLGCTYHWKRVCSCSKCFILCWTNWGWDKMAAIFQMTFSDTFS